MAVDLGLRGIDCAVIERHKTPQRIPKGQGLTQRTLERFYFWGIVNELRAARVMPMDYPLSGVTAYGDMMSEHWYTPPGRKAVRTYYYEDNDRLPQYELEQVLRTKMADLPSVRGLFERSATKVEQDANGVRVTVADQFWPYDVQVLEADYLVGCDGTRSIVRDQLGIGRRGSDFEQKMVLAVFRSREHHEAFEHFGKRTTYRVLHPDLNGYWMFFGRVDVGEGWFFHAPVPNDTTTDNYDFQPLLNRAAGFEFEAELDHVGFWDLRVSVADRYQVGRGFIAGDAAHSHPPYGGYGLNNGLEDVANLGWKLTAKLEGWGGDALLESYGEERLPILWETGEDFIATGIRRDREFLERYSPDRDVEEFKGAWKELEKAGHNQIMTYEPHYEGSSVVMGPPNAVCSAHGSHSFVARPGHHLPPQPLSSGRDVQAELGMGFTLLAFGGEDVAVQSIEQAAKSLRVPLKVVRDTYEGGREEYESRLVLVRPDQYVVWSGDSAPSDAVRLMQKVAGIS